MRTLTELIASYTIRVIPLPPEDDGGFKAFYEELGSTIPGYGESQAEAVAALEEMMLDVMANEDLSQFPEPKTEQDWTEYSGRLTLRLSKTLHHRADKAAAEQGVSLNSFVSEAVHEYIRQLSGEKTLPQASAKTGDKTQETPVKKRSAS